MGIFAMVSRPTPSSSNAKANKHMLAKSIFLFGNNLTDNMPASADCQARVFF